MEAVIIEDLFKGNQLEELRHWLDNETPYWDDQTWERSTSGVMKKTCPELNTYHIATIDKARDIFAVHDLLPTFSTLNWYDDPLAQKQSYIDISNLQSDDYYWVSATSINGCEGPKSKITIDKTWKSTF